MYLRWPSCLPKIINLCVALLSSKFYFVVANFLILYISCYEHKRCAHKNTKICWKYFYIEKENTVLRWRHRAVVMTIETTACDYSSQQASIMAASNESTLQRKRTINRHMWEIERNKAIGVDDRSFYAVDWRHWTFIFK